MCRPDFREGLNAFFINTGLFKYVIISLSYNEIILYLSIINTIFLWLT